MKIDRAVRPMSRRLVRDRRGAATVELGVAIPFLLIFIVGVVSFGQLYLAAVEVTSAAAAGALYGAQNNALAADANGIRQAARRDAQDGGLTVVSGRQCRCPSGTVVNCVTGTCPNNYGVPQVYVRVTATRRVNLAISHPSLTPVTTVRRTAELRVF